MIRNNKKFNYNIGKIKESKNYKRIRNNNYNIGRIKTSER